MNNARQRQTQASPVLAQGNRRAFRVRRSAAKAPTWILAYLWVAVGCGSNVFRSLEDNEAPEDATVLLEKGDTDGAERVLLDALGKKTEDAVVAPLSGTYSDDIRAACEGVPERAKLLSLLSYAYARRVQVDPLTIALKLADSKSSGSSGGSSSNSVTTLFPVLPEATVANIEGVDRALAILQAIPAAEFGTSDLYKQALLLSSSFALRAKTLDTDGDGVISPAESVNLSPSNAIAILIQIAQASETIGGSQVGDNGAKVAKQLEVLQTGIAASEGATEEEKLKNFLANQGAAKTATALSGAERSDE